MKTRKLINWIIILTLIFSVVLSGCKTEGNQVTIEKPLIDVSVYPDGIPVYLSLPSSIRPADEEYLKWKNYIKDKYEITFDLKYVDYIIDTENASDKVDTSLGLDIGYYRNLDMKEGFIKFIEPGDLAHLIENDLIIPLNEYIPEIQGLVAMNQKVFEQFTDSDGNLWAFPDSGQMAMRHRIYNKKWLDESGFKMPDNIWEFLDYARYIKTQDPDGNGIDDTYIQEYRANSLLDYFSDIFAAYGCYFNYSMPVAYNPITEKYENVIENENFKNALIYILQLKEEGLIRETGYDLIYADGGSGKGYLVGSEVGFSDAPESFNEWAFGSCMTGDNDRQLDLVQTPRTGFAVLKDTTNAGDIMNAIYTLTDNIEGHCDLNYGREGYNYVIEDKKINVTRITEDNQVRYPIMMNTRYFNLTENGFYVSRDGKVENIDMDRQQKYLEEKKEYEEALMNTKYTYSLPFETNSLEIFALNIALIDETEKLFEDIFKRNMDIDKAIESFMKVYMELDSEDIVSEKNHQLDN